MRRVLLSLVVAAHHVVFAQSTPATTAAEVRSARVAQNAAIAARNADSVASFWIDDVAVTAGLGYVLRGRTAYRAAFGHDAPMLYSRIPERIEVSQNWPLAWEEGRWTATATGQKEPIMAGRYSAQWVKQNGRWLIRSEVFVALTCSGPACQWPLRLQ